MAPQRTVGKKRLPVHQKGADIREVGTQPVEDRKTVRIDIPPIEKIDTRKPPDIGQTVHPVAKAKNDQPLGNIRECQPVDLVFRNEDPVTPR